MFHWRPSIWGPLRCWSDDGDAVEDDVDVDGFPEESEKAPPPPTCLLVQEDRDVSKHTAMHGEKFREPCNGDRRDEESPLFDCWDWKHDQSDVLQQVDPWARNAPKSVPNVKSCLSLCEHPVFVLCVRSWVCTNICQFKLHRMTSPVRVMVDPDEVPVEVLPM